LFLQLLEVVLHGEVQLLNGSKIKIIKKCHLKKYS